MNSNISIIGLFGLKNSGKSTVANFLEEEHGYIHLAFASLLKDVVSVAFRWDRKMLEGDTEYSRKWRETIDEWWAKKLNMPHLTPRFVLQYWGTEVIRNSFHDQFWIIAVEREITELIKQGKRKIVVSDCRFENEENLITQLGGININIIRPTLVNQIDTHSSEGYVPKIAIQLNNDVEGIENLKKAVEKLIF
jgi:hypothetical protein